MGTDVNDWMEKMKPRCIEDGGCLLWQGKRNLNGLPVYKGRSMRREVWERTKGELLPRQLVSVKCEHCNCIEPEHLVLTTKQAAGRKANEPIDVRLRRARSLSATKRKNSVLNIEAVRSIRSETSSLVEMAARYGVSASLVSKIRLNKAWREATPFSGLGARA